MSDDTFAILRDYESTVGELREAVARLTVDMEILVDWCDRLRTAKLLKDIKVKHSVLIMNPYSTRYSNKHKAEVAHLLRNRVSLAIDDNPNARAGYASVGIEVIDPVPMYTSKI
jgi:hypothetical protein